MKSKHLLRIILFYLPLMQMAQSGLSNLSFENWTTTVFGNAPVGWIGINTSKQTTGAQDGNSYVRVTNSSFTGGALMLSNNSSIQGGVIKSGVPYNQMPTAISGFYKTSGLIATDVVRITAYTSNSGTVNSMAMFTESVNVANWTSFSAPFIPFGNPAVDTLAIVVTAANSATYSQGIIFDVDNFSLSGLTSTGIDERSLGTAFLVYPNPAVGQLNILSKDTRAVSVLVTDISGKIMDEILITSENTQANVQSYAAGIYFYAICDQEKHILLSGKFAVVK